MNFAEVVRPYQRTAINHLINEPAYMLWLPVGFGKTAVTLTALQVLRDHNAIQRALIIAPKHVAQSIWPAEIERWEDLDLTVAAAVGTPRHRMKQLESDADVVTINWENTPWLVSSGTLEKFDCLVLDEVSLWKSHQSARMKALYKAGDWEYCWGLTGSPMPNDDILELWAQYHLVCRERSPLGRHFSKFRDATHIPPPPFTFEWTPLPGARKKVQKAIAPYTYHVRRKEVAVQIPDSIEVPHWLTLPDESRGLYKELVKKFFADLGDTKILVPNAAVLTGKLAQVCSGFLYTDPDPTWLHEEKLEALLEIRDSIRPDGRMLIPYWFKANERILSERLGALPVTPDTIKAWNADEVDALMIHPRSAGHGLNLQHGERPVHICWYDPTWSAEADHQTNGRVIRSGHAAGPVTVHRLLIRDTIEEDMREAVCNRQSGEQAMMKAVKELRDAVR